jgi:hypothetical protein
MTDTVSDSGRLSDEVFPHYAVENNSNGAAARIQRLAATGAHDH